MPSELWAYKIADALHLPIRYWNGKVHGSSKVTLPMLDDVQVQHTTTALFLFSGAQSGVICHVSGDLYILMAYNDATSAMSAYLINDAVVRKTKIGGIREIIKQKEFSPSAQLRAIVMVLRPAIVAAFWYQGDWKPLQLPD